MSIYNNYDGWKDIDIYKKYNINNFVYHPLYLSDNLYLYGNTRTTTEKTEYEKCKSNFNYFCSKYLKINHLTKGIIPLNLHEYQKTLINCYENNKWIAVPKFRQGGFTTTNIAYSLWKSIFKENTRILYICTNSHSEEIANKILSLMIKSLPPDWKNKNENNSSLVITTPKQILDGYYYYNYDIIVIDEAAYMPDVLKLWNYLSNNFISKNYTLIKCILTSGLNKPNDWFSDVCNHAINKINSFLLFEPKYKDNPEFSSKEWEEITKKQLGEVNFAREYECKFIDNKTKIYNAYYGTIKNSNDNLSGITNFLNKSEDKNSKTIDEIYISLNDKKLSHKEKMRKLAQIVIRELQDD